MGYLGYVAIDQSKARTGWAAWQEGWEKPVVGSEVLGTPGFTSDGQVYTKLRETLIGIFSVVTPFEYLWYEELVCHLKTSNTSPDTVLLLTGLRGAILGVGYELRCRRVDSVNERRWRAAFLGSDENSMIRRAARAAKKTATDPLKAASMERCRQLGIGVKYHDEAEAVGILTYSLLNLAITPPWLAAESLFQPLEIPA